LQIAADFLCHTVYNCTQSSACGTSQSVDSSMGNDAAESAVSSATAAALAALSTPLLSPAAKFPSSNFNAIQNKDRKQVDNSFFAGEEDDARSYLGSIAPSVRSRSSVSTAGRLRAEARDPSDPTATRSTRVRTYACP
jgi:hypothetical protein